MGQKCLKNKIKPKDKKTTSYFSKKICQSCQHLNDCPVKLNKRKAVLTWTWNKPKTESRTLTFEQDQSTISLYRQRSGVEATFSLAKRKFGLGINHEKKFSQKSITNIFRSHRNQRPSYAQLTHQWAPKPSFFKEQS